MAGGERESLKQKTNLWARFRITPVVKGSIQQEIVALVAFTLLLLIGWLDYSRQSPVTFWILYLVPIIGVSIYGRLLLAVSFTVFAAIVSLLADLLSTPDPSLYIYDYWEAFIRLLIWGVAAIAICRLAQSNKALREYQEALEQEHQKVHELARTDELTGLFNLRYLNERINEEIGRSCRFAHPLAVLMIDVDNLKGVNDTYGHAEGDRLLREIARTLRAAVRSVDVVARVGGDEFVIILPETGAQGARAVAERILGLVRDRVKLFDTIVPTVSIGLASYERVIQSGEGLIKAADEALYQAKRAGRGQFREVSMVQEVGTEGCYG
ncbi:MAG: GGDEF domain-containing protein [Chloroflexi bacterium]|nr:GGDEF domain-containing protein [Chloroflexota bacterium]MCL5076146.1 GGDEF domain-containing protein [Chloroflexota bacterium]